MAKTEIPRGDLHGSSMFMSIHTNTSVGELANRTSSNMATLSRSSGSTSNTCICLVRIQFKPALGISDSVCWIASSPLEGGTDARAKGTSLAQRNSPCTRNRTTRNRTYVRNSNRTAELHGQPAVMRGIVSDLLTEKAWLLQANNAYEIQIQAQMMRSEALQLEISQIPALCAWIQLIAVVRRTCSRSGSNISSRSG